MQPRGRSESSSGVLAVRPTSQIRIPAADLGVGVADPAKIVLREVAP